MATKYKPYEESEAVRDAYNKLQEQQAQRPSEYQSGFKSQLDGIMDKINNREKFRYDLNGDALYQQYKNQYIHGGNLAMRDTMGQAAALTGGYGNSYAQQAGQQAYNGYLNGLNDKIPDLYNMALSRYQMEGNDLKDQYSMLASREAQDYARYQDAMNAWMNEMNHAQSRYDTERNLDYSKYADDLAYQYKMDRDAVSDAQWQANFDEAKRQYDQNFAASQAKSSGGGGGSTKAYKGLSDNQLTILDNYAKEGNTAGLKRAIESYIYNGLIDADYGYSLLSSYGSKTNNTKKGSGQIPTIYKLDDIYKKYL